MARDEIRIRAEAFPELLHGDTKGMMAQAVVFQVTDVSIVRHRFNVYDMFWNHFKDSILGVTSDLRSSAAQFWDKRKSLFV